MFKTKSLSTNKKLNYFLSFLLMIAPLIPVLIIQLYYTLFYCGDSNLLTFSPQWSDELSHFRITRDILEYGEPLGYYGYNGSHAILFSGVWSPLRELGYVLYGLCFGFEHYSPLVANILFLCFANLFFILLTKPSNKQLFLLICFNLTSYCFIYFTFSCMSECFFYALAIIACGILYRLQFKHTSLFFKYVVSPLYFLLCGLICVSLIIFIGVYFLIIFKKYSLRKNICLTTLLSAICLVMTYMFSISIEAPYPESWSNPFSASHLNSIYGFVKKQMVNIPTNSVPVFTYSFALFVILCCFCIYFFLRMIRKKDARFPEMLCVTLLLFGFFGALFIMYPSESLWRNLLIILVFTLYALILLVPEKKLFCLLISCALIGTLLCNSNCLNNVATHHIDKNFVYDNAEEETALLHRLIEINPEKGKWENTVLIFSTNYLFLPTGAGINLYLSPKINIPTEIGYAMVDVTLSKYDDISIALTNAGYIEIHKDDTYAIYENTRYR